jgi:hypothetical protein
MEGPYRPGNIFVENLFNSRAAAFDISVTHPAALTYYKAAAKKDNAAATEREIGKFKKYEEAMALNPIPANFIFQPLVVETFGSWSDAATQVLVRIGKSLAMESGLDSSTAITRLYQRLSVILQTRNADMILNHKPTIA